MANCPAPKTLAAGKKTPKPATVTATVKKAKAPTKAPVKLKVQIDERTKSMPAEALDCRMMGHAWQRVPMATERRLELFARGETETVRFCQRCRSRRIDVYELPTFFTLYSKIEYSDGYLIGKEFRGTGRMPRQAAVAAAVVAEMPELLGV